MQMFFNQFVSQTEKITKPTKDFHFRVSEVWNGCLQTQELQSQQQETKIAPIHRKL